MQEAKGACFYKNVRVCVIVSGFKRSCLGKTQPVCLDVGGCVWANLLCLAEGHLYGSVCVCVQ